MDRPRHVLDEQLRATVAGAVVMVTGASSGIGAATAVRMGQAGATVLLVARSEEGLLAVEQRIVASGGSAKSLVNDLCDREATQSLIDVVLRDYGSVDVLVSNAGRSIRRPIEQSYDRLHDFERTVDVNYLGPVQLVLGLLPGMRERRRGHIINVSSLGVLFSAPRFAAYLGSKSAFDTFLRCVTPEVTADGVAITSVYLPLVRTPMMEPIKTWGALPRLTAEGAADRICKAAIKRPVAMAPRFTKLGRALEVLSPSGYEALLESVYRPLEDRGTGAHEKPELDLEVPRLQFALRHMSRVRSLRRSGRR